MESSETEPKLPARFEIEMEMAKKIYPEKFGINVSQEELDEQLEIDKRRAAFHSNVKFYGAVFLLSALAGYWVYQYTHPKKEIEEEQEEKQTPQQPRQNRTKK
jgi:hypothetical protein